MPVRPLVSVVIPTYNAVEYLRDTIASVLAQTMGDLECIVVDDGSTDGTAAYLASVDDPRVRLLRREHTGNVAAGRNAGAAAARGRYLAFLDHDDLWLPEKLESQLAVMRDTGTRWSYTDLEHCDADGARVPHRGWTFEPVDGWLFEAFLEWRAVITLLTVVMERGLFDALGGFDADPRLAWADDMDMRLRLTLTAPGSVVPRPLARLRLHAARTTHDLGSAYIARAAACAYGKSVRVARDPAHRRMLRRLRDEHWAKAGVLYLRSGAPLRAARCLARGLPYASPRRVARAVARRTGLTRRHRPATGP